MECRSLRDKRRLVRLTAQSLAQTQRCYSIALRSSVRAPHRKPLLGFVAAAHLKFALRTLSGAHNSNAATCLRRNAAPLHVNTLIGMPPAARLKCSRARTSPPCFRRTHYAHSSSSSTLSHTDTQQLAANKTISHRIAAVECKMESCAHKAPQLTATNSQPLNWRLKRATCHTTTCCV